MGRVGYDGILALMRVDKAGRREADPFLVDVLTYHAAVEAEMDQFLIKAMKRPEMLTRGKLGFGHKITVVGAAWDGDAGHGDKLNCALMCFNELRNAVAHNEQRKTMEKLLANLVTAVAAFDPNLPEDVDLRGLAIRTCAFMGNVTLGRQYTSEGWTEEKW